jgi:hypothetical protein
VEFTICNAIEDPGICSDINRGVDELVCEGGWARLPLKRRAVVMGFSMLDLPLERRIFYGCSCFISWKMGLVFILEGYAGFFV